MEARKLGNAVTAALLAFVLAVAGLAFSSAVALADTIPDGEYQVPVKAMNASNGGSTESMMNDAIDGDATVVVANGKATYSVNFKAKNLGSIKGHLIDLWVYPAGDTDSSKVETNANKAKVTATFRDTGLDGKEGTYNRTFQFTRDAAGESQIRVRVRVDAMDAYHQDALLVFDWTGVSDPEKAAARSSLNAAILKAKAISNDDGTYTSASYQALQDAIDSADAVAIDSDATTDQLNSALQALTKAQNALVTQESVDRAAAAQVTQQIQALPAVDALTLDNKAAVQAVQAAYNALTDAQKGYVDAEVKASLDAAVSKIASLEQAAADQKAADAVAAQIDALPATDALTLNDRAAVDAAARAYDALTDDQKALVDATKASMLRSAQQCISDLLQNATQEEKDTTAAASVTAQIQALPAADKMTLGDQADVQAARAAYNALTDGAKSRVGSDDVNALTAAEAKIKQLGDAATAVKDAIEKLPTADQLKLTDEDAVASARSAYDALDQYQQDAVGTGALTTLQSAEARIATLKEQAQKAAEKAATDRKRADAVVGIIAKLPASDSLSLSDAKDVSDARAAYDGLTDSQKALVADAYTTLQKAEQRIAALQASQAAADNATALIRALPDASAVTTKSEAAITKARAAYDGLDADAKGMVAQSDYSRLTAAETALTAAKNKAAADAKKNTSSAKKKTTETKKVTAKKANPIKVKASKKTLKYKTLKKKALKVTLKASKAKGKVTFKKAKSSGIYKKVSISSKGKVTFKKKAKKGTYSFKVKAAGNASYKAKTVTVKIKVK